MKILWDGTGIGSKMTGMVNYSLNLIDRMVKLYPNNNYNIILRPTFHNTNLLPANVRILKHRVPNLGLTRELKYLTVLRKITAKHFDVFHCLTGNWPVSLRGGICTFHDLRYFSHPDSYFGSSYLKCLYLRTAFKNALNACNQIIAVSESTKAQIIKYAGGRLRNPVTVIRHGFNPHLQEDTHACFPRLDNLKPYILFVGEMKKHKNLPVLVHAFHIFKNHYDTHHTSLVIVGKKHQDTLQAIRKIRTRNIVITGHVTNSQLLSLYRNASVFALLSLVEGFGLPLLEAMHHNVPIICSNIPALTEVAADAAITVCPNDPQPVARTFARLLDDPQLQKHLRTKGRRRLAEFNWKQTAEKTYQIYQQYLLNKRTT